MEYRSGKYSVIAEIAPLPGFSSTDFNSIFHEILRLCDSLDDILDQISNEISQIDLNQMDRSGNPHSNGYDGAEMSTNASKDTPARLQLIELVRDISEKHFSVLQKNFAPEINFAIDSIILQMCLQHFTSTENASDIHIPVNCTINSTESARICYDQGFRTFKVKVGLDLEKELYLVRDVREMFEGVHIRLDANGAWNQDIAEKALKSFQPYNIQYIEQPVDEFQLTPLGKQLRTFGIPIAADESARDLNSISALIENQSSDVLVLKPTLTGSIGNLLDIVETSRAHGQSIVFTSTLDSAINRILITFLVSVLSDLKYAQGLATGQLLEFDLVSEPDHIENGHLILSTDEISTLASSIRYERLVRIR